MSPNGTTRRLVGSEKVGSHREGNVCRNYNPLMVCWPVMVWPLPALAHLDQHWAGVNHRLMMLPLAQQAWQQQQFAAPHDHQPVYLRESVAWKKLAEQPSLRMCTARLYVPIQYATAWLDRIVGVNLMSHLRAVE